MKDLSSEQLEGRECLLCKRKFVDNYEHGCPVVCKECYSNLDDKEESLYIKTSVEVINNNKKKGN